MIQDEMKNEFLMLSPSQSYDGSIIINNNQKENSFQVGKRINMSHPRQPSYEAEEDKTPAFETFDLKIKKQTQGTIWQFQNQRQQINVKINITEVNTFQKNQKKVLFFIEKLKQNIALTNKRFKTINSILFSPLNAGKKLYKNSIKPQLKIIWNSIIFFFCSLLLIVSPIEYIYQQNGYQNYLFATMIVLNILDQAYKYTSQKQQDQYLKYSKQFLQYVFQSTTFFKDTFSIVFLAVIILSNSELIKTISFLLIKFLIFKKIIYTFNKRFYYELSDLKIQAIQILLTFHLFSCIKLRQAFLVNQEVIAFQEVFDQYLNIYINYILQFGNLQIDIDQEVLQNQAFNICTTLIIFFYKILLLKLIILDSLYFFEDFKKNKDLKLLQRFLHKQNVSQTLKDQISIKLDQIFSKNQNQVNIENYFESCLQKEQVFQEFKEQNLINFVNSFSIFNKFSKSTKQQIAQHLTPMILNKNERLICNQFGDQYNIYLLYSGQAAYGLTEKISDYHKIFRGQSFGQYSFFTGQDSKHLITSLEYCVLYKLSRDKFLQIISQNVQDLEIAAYIKDQILFNSSYQLIDSVCFYCQEKTHLIINCPKVYFIKNNIDFYDKLLYSPNQNRRIFTRRRKQNKDYIRNHFRTQNILQINHISNDDISSELNQLSFSNIDQNIEKKDIKFKVESCNNLLNDINNEDMKLNDQKEQFYQEIPSQNSSQSYQQQKTQSKNIYDLKISKLLNRGNSLKILPSLSSNASPIVKIQTPSLPTITEFQNLVNDNLCMENIYKIDLDFIQNYQIYYPEYNIMMVLFRVRRNQNRAFEQRSKLTINQNTAKIIGKIISKTDKFLKI